MTLTSHTRAWRGVERRSPFMMFIVLCYIAIIVVFVRHNFAADPSVEETIKDIFGNDLRALGLQEYNSDIKSLGTPNEHFADIIQSSPEVVFFIILCQGKARAGQGGKKAADITRQLRQAAVMLKSAVALTSTTMRFIVAADSKNLYKRFSEIPLSWPVDFQEKVVMEYHEVWYPPDRMDMRNMFRVCATERLFLPDMFPDLDAAIYIDTDLVFLRPPEDLWKEFSKFDGMQLAAMAPCLYHYGTKKNKVPFYGTSGLNAGIMHMNLTRMKNFPGGGWTPANMKVFDKYKKTITLADQDILNILFNKHPDLLYELGCKWNYRLWQCTQGRNMCPEAADDGASIIHGNAMAFVSGAEMKLQVLFEAWENHTLGSPLQSFLSLLKENLKEVTMMRKPSKCALLPEIDDILTKELMKHIEL